MNGKETIAEAAERARERGWSIDDPWAEDWNVAQFYVAAADALEGLYGQLLAFELNTSVARERRAARRVAYKLAKALRDLKRPAWLVLHAGGEEARGAYVDANELTAPGDWDEFSPQWEALILALKLGDQMALLALRDAGWRRGGLLVGRTGWLILNLLKLFGDEEAPAVIAQANDIGLPSPVRRGIAYVADERDGVPGVGAAPDVPGASEGGVVRLETERQGGEEERERGEDSEAPRVRRVGRRERAPDARPVKNVVKLPVVRSIEEDGWDE